MARHSFARVVATNLHSNTLFKNVAPCGAMKPVFGGKDERPVQLAEGMRKSGCGLGSADHGLTKHSIPRLSDRRSVLAPERANQRVRVGGTPIGSATCGNRGNSRREEVSLNRDYTWAVSRRFFN